MSFRVTVLVAVAAVLGFSSLTPAFAQPQAPVKPRYTQFQNMFSPYRPLVANPGQGIQGANLPNPNPSGPQVPGFVYPGQSGAAVQQPAGPGTVDPTIKPTGMPVTFNNLGHWYSRSTGYYGTWYPNGVANGYGVLAATGGNPGSMSGSTPGMLPRPGGSPLGTALMSGAVVNQFRR